MLKLAFPTSPLNHVMCLLQHLGLPILLIFSFKLLLITRFHLTLMGKVSLFINAFLTVSWFLTLHRRDTSWSHCSLTQLGACPSTIRAVEGVQNWHFLTCLMLSLGEFTEKYGSLYPIEKSKLSRIDKNWSFTGGYILRWWLHFAAGIAAKCNHQRKM